MIHNLAFPLFVIGSNDEWGFEKDVIEKLPHCVTYIPYTFNLSIKIKYCDCAPKTLRVQFK